MKVTLIAALTGLSMLGSSPPSRPAPAPAPDDAAILADFEEMVSADLACAQLASERGHSKDARDFGGVLVREHTMARQMARDAAAQIGVKFKMSSDGPRHSEHDKILRSLRERPDAAFDVLFARHEMEYHKELVELINKQWMPAAKNPDLTAFFGQVGPAFEAHSKMADELWKRVAPAK